MFHLAFMSFATVIYLNVKNSLKVFRKQKRHGIFSLNALGAEGKCADFIQSSNILLGGD